MSKTTKVKIKVQPTVVIESEVARKIRQHARSSMKAEVCGVLIGSTDDERTVVDACIHGVNAAQGGAHVTFTQDTWEHIYKIKDKDYPDDKIVGWYHSHPGFGVFLSEHDLFIQENFFSSPRQVAWVYDPHTDEEGCFGWVSGKIEKLSGVRFGYLQGVTPGEGSSANAEQPELDDDAVSVTPVSPRHRSVGEEPAWMKWMSRALAFLVVALMGAVAGYIVGQRQMAAQVDRELNREFGAALRTCDQISQHPVEACRQILERYAPPGSAVPGDNTQPTQPKNPSQKKRQDDKH
jgi:proteasome lid subunit RPN8/RPN11